MVKLITFLHRKPGMSREAFIERYENGHREIGEKYLSPYATRYVRRYCQLQDLEPLDAGTSPPDVIMEIWFPDEATYELAMADLTTPEAQAEIIADERQLFDRSRMVSFVVDEYESKLNGGN